MTQPDTPDLITAAAVEADLWMALHDAMDGNLRVSRRRKLLADYKAAVLNVAAAQAAKTASGASGAPVSASEATPGPQTPETPPQARTEPHTANAPAV